MIDHYDNVVYEDAPVLSTAFEKVFIWEEPHYVCELRSWGVMNKEAENPL